MTFELVLSLRDRGLTYIACRYDESEGRHGQDEDDGTKRKKEFSELFKKQMGLRKVRPPFLGGGSWERWQQLASRC